MPGVRQDAAAAERSRADLRAPLVPADDLAVREELGDFGLEVVGFAAGRFGKVEGALDRTVRVVRAEAGIGKDVVSVRAGELVMQLKGCADGDAIVACGGFSFGDVLGAGGGWARSILYNDRLRDEFEGFFHGTDRFSLGI